MRVGLLAHSARIGDAIGRQIAAKLDFFRDCGAEVRAILATDGGVDARLRPFVRRLSAQRPDTILAWHRKLVAQKFDGSQQRKALGRPKIDTELEALVIRMARENRSWGYDRIVGALANLGYTISDQTVGNILKRHGIPPAPARKKTTTWKEFIRTHMDVLVATDFFTAEVWTLGGLVTYYVLFFLHLGTRKVHVAGVTPHPDTAWMVQVARNITMEEWGSLAPGQYLIHDRDTKFCAAFQQIIDEAGIERVVLPPRSPNLKAYAAYYISCVRWIMNGGQRSAFAPVATHI